MQPGNYFSKNGVDSTPTSFYVQPTDAIFMRVMNTVASQNVLLTMRLLLPTGEIKKWQRNMTPPSDGSSIAQRFPITEGWILSGVITLGQPTRHGETFVQVCITDSPEPNSSPNGMLCSGYVSSDTFLGWPGMRLQTQLETPGNIVVQVHANPALGANLTITVPTNLVWDFQSIFFNFSTDANVATRIVSLRIDDGANQYFQIDDGTGQGAGISGNYCFAQQGANSTLIVNERTIAIPKLLIREAHRVRIVVTNIQVGDTINGITSIRQQWMDDPT